jgi:hypothetical protein
MLKIFLGQSMSRIAALAASVDVERLWSVAGNIFTDKRNRMFDETLTTELFLKSNIDIVVPEKNTSPVTPTISSLNLFKIRGDVEHAIFDEILVENEDCCSDLEVGSDEELKALIEEEKELLEMQEDDGDDSSEGVACSFWETSTATKNFNSSLKNLPERRTSRKRKRDENFNSSKRRKRMEGRKWIPQVGDKVRIAYPDDCKCNSEILIDCSCSDVWFEGIVISGILHDDEKKESGFHVNFGEDSDDDDIDHVEYDLIGNNERWVYLC